MFRLTLFAALALAASFALLSPPAEGRPGKAKLHGTGGRRVAPKPHEILTKARFGKVLNTASANPYLLRVRARYGAKFSPRLMALTKTLAKPRAAASGRPAVVDWRTRWGASWITRAADQGSTENCWAFASNALIEAMVRIEHGVWCERSVTEIRKGVKKKVTDGGNANEALVWVKGHGLADPGCTPYSLDDKPLAFPADRSGRTVRIPAHERIPNDAGQEAAKKWLDAVGPLVCFFEVWTDFDDSKNVKGVVYRARPGATFRGNHLMLIVGYDDNAKCWIVKNSWGQGFGDNGFVRIGYGQRKIDTEEKYGVRLTNPDPLLKARLHNGGMVESGNGSLHRNFELVSFEAGRTRHRWREGGDFSWHKGEAFGNDSAGNPQMISTTQNRNFEVVYRTKSQRLHSWMFDQATKKWIDQGVFGPLNVVSAPGIVQNGAYRELVVLAKDGTLRHWSRLGSRPKTGWSEKAKFGKGINHSGPALVVSRGPAARQGLDLVVVGGGAMQHWQQQGGPRPGWRLLETFGPKTTTPPCMIEGQYAAKDEKAQGNYELCVAAGGKIEHWWRDNNGDKKWRKSAVFGSGVERVLSLVEGSYGFNLEVVARRKDGKLQHWFRDGAGWHAGAVLP